MLLLSLIAIQCIGAADCIKDPGNSECVNFVIPDETLIANSNKLCGMMYMSGCSIMNNCHDDGQRELYPEFCSPFGVFRLLCTDMPGMMGCEDWRSMCMNASSVVKQCNTTVVRIPDTDQLGTDIKTFCGEMNMPGCEKCDADFTDCDGLRVLSDLCLSMEMNGCQDWTTMCKDVPKWNFCDGGATPIPQMIMYFHFSINEYLLFKGLVPTTTGEYVVALIIIFVCSVLYELMKLARFYQEKSMSNRNKVSLVNHKHHAEEKNNWEFKRALVKSVWHLLEVGVGSLLMLLLMTFNVPIVIVIIVGRAVGAFIVGNRMETNKEEETAECH